MAPKYPCELPSNVHWLWNLAYLTIGIDLKTSLGLKNWHWLRIEATSIKERWPNLLCQSTTSDSFTILSWAYLTDLVSLLIFVSISWLLCAKYGVYFIMLNIFILLYVRLVALDQ